jgi:hypothetical protein
MALIWPAVSVESQYFGIQVVDENGRGVPLVELTTVNEIVGVTDNAGWLAFDEPGMMGREVCWTVSGPGVERAKDGFGYASFRAVAEPGKTVKLEVKTSNIATRVGRLTGTGLHRDSELLGLASAPRERSEIRVAGQDSVQAVLYQHQIFWLWGDTATIGYPLGNFHTTCAWTPREIEPERGISFDYLTDSSDPKKLRKMLPSDEPGAMWIFGLMALTDAEGNERMFSGFSRQQGLVPAEEKGVAEFDPKKGVFRKIADVAKNEKWRYPHGHAMRAKTADGDHFYFTSPFASVRVRADAKAIANPSAYELLWFDPAKQQWAWQHEQGATDQRQEVELLRSQKMKPEQARYQLRDARTGKLVMLHGASIQWNEWRKKFIMIAVQSGEKGDPSALGEVWYAESDAPSGPWNKGIKVASHPAYTFYNPVQHGFMNRDGGKVIFFEGTYTNQFSGNPRKTMRYDYNQLLYRLDLSDSRLDVLR